MQYHLSQLHNVQRENEELYVNNNSYNNNNHNHNHSYNHNHNQNQQYESYERQETNTHSLTNDDFLQLSRANLARTIRRNITRLKYSEIENPLNNICSITQEEFQPDDEVAILNECKHIFKYESLITWLIQHQACPLCRSNIMSNSGLIKYSSGTNSTPLFLTQNQFRTYFSNNVVSNLFDRMVDGSGNSGFVLSLLR